MTEPTIDRPMLGGEQWLADSVYQAIQNASNQSERSQQSQDFRIGISDLGYCSEKVRRMVAGIAEPVTDKLPAFIGTAVGSFVEMACTDLWPNAIVQAAVEVTLVGDGGSYVVTGHPDLILPEEGLLIDFKTTRGLQTVRRLGPSTQQQYQRHCYALGAFNAGLFAPELTLDKIEVANVWLDRAADDRELYVHMEPFSQNVVDEAAMWVDDVVYAYLHDQPARKEPAREVCARTCGHFADCRALDTDVEGLLTDDTVLVSVDLYREALDLERKARAMKDVAKSNLTDVTGSTGKFTVRWVHVNGSHVEFDRDPYDRLDIRTMK
jgi:hypothetical protein